MKGTAGFFKFSLWFFALWMGIMSAHAEAEEELTARTPTDVFYLAKSIDDSLVHHYELTGVFEKKMISYNLRPANVYEKVLIAAAEFNVLHRGAIDRISLQNAGSLESKKAKPANVYTVLGFMKDYLQKENMFLDWSEIQKTKTPSDVFHMLRRLSFHHFEIAKKMGIEVNWAQPELVYDSVVTKIIPSIQEIGDRTDTEYKPYPFPPQPVTGVIPRYVYKVIAQVYRNMSQALLKEKRYDPIELEPVNDCDNITPLDVFDLVQVIASELKAESGNRAIDAETMNRYAQWKNMKEKIVPGDVFRLIQHLLIISDSIMAGKAHS